MQNPNEADQPEIAPVHSTFFDDDGDEWLVKQKDGKYYGYCPDYDLSTFPQDTPDNVQTAANWLLGDK